MELKELVEKQYKSITEKEGIKAFRKKAFDSFVKEGIPTSKHEEWKYADFTKVLKSDFSLLNSELTEADIKPFLFDAWDGNLVVVVNGNYSAKLSKIVSPEEEVKIKNFSDAKDSLTDKINQFADAKNNPFSSLSAALATSGVYVEVSKNKVVEKPILILNICDKRANSVLAQPRNFISIGANAQVKIVESFYSIGSLDSFTNAYTEIYTGKDSVSELYKLQLEDSAASLVDTTQVFQEGKSTFTCTTITLSGNMVRNNLNLVLNGEYCEGNMNGLYMLKGNTLVDNHTSVDHAFPNSLSNEMYKGILDDKSTGVFNGKIFVRKNAQKTNAYQSNKNLLLSDEASINTKPQLEIWANDVKCSHGATTGKLDKDMLFYLRARGISERSAKAILMNAFAHDVLDTISLDSVKEYLNKIIKERLGLDY
jgi:Fe-S cluster assembly protein SufD